MRAKALALRGRLTADFTNDEDSIGRPGRLREDLQSLAGGGFFGGAAPPNAAQREYAARVDAAYAVTMRDVAAFERGEVARANAALRAAGKPALATSRRQARRRGRRRARRPRTTSPRPAGYFLARLSLVSLYCTDISVVSNEPSCWRCTMSL